MILLNIYLWNVLLCSVINIINKTRFPITIMDFIKLTFFPYLIVNLQNVKK